MTLGMKWEAGMQEREDGSSHISDGRRCGTPSEPAAISLISQMTVTIGLRWARTGCQSDILLWVSYLFTSDICENTFNCEEKLS